jgi:hypothetical protein
MGGSIPAVHVLRRILPLNYLLSLWKDVIWCVCAADFAAQPMLQLMT